MSTPSTKIMPDCSGCSEACSALIDLERQAVLALKDGVGVDPNGVRELRVEVDALVVSVHRHHVAWSDEVEHQLQLLDVAVA